MVFFNTPQTQIMVSDVRSVRGGTLRRYPNVPQNCLKVPQVCLKVPRKCLKVPLRFTGTATSIISQL